MSADNNLGRILGNPKDKIQEHDKSGIYCINCEMCPKKYIGQTKRSIKIRGKEHFSHFKYNRPDKSAMVKHCLDENHHFKIENSKLLKNVTKPNTLDAWETFYINKYRNIIVNNDLGPIQDSLLI